MSVLDGQLGKAGFYIYDPSEEDVTDSHEEDRIEFTTVGLSGIEVTCLHGATGVCGEPERTYTEILFDIVSVSRK